MEFKIWRQSIEDPRLQSILCSFGGEVTDEVAPKNTHFQDDITNVIFGSWKDRDVPHHNLKREVVKKSKNLIVMETPLLDRSKVELVMPDDWVRVGLNGFMRNADYPIPSSDRLQKVLKETGVGKHLEMKTKSDGDYILVVMQIPGDASLDMKDMNEWVQDTVKAIRKITDRDIVLRFPQLDTGPYYKLDWTKELKGIYFQHGTYKDKDVTLDNAYAVVTYSSGMGVEAILKSRRTYIESPNGFWSKQSSLSDVLSKEYENFHNEKNFDQWLGLIVGTQWHKSEIESGECRKVFEEMLEKQ